MADPLRIKVEKAVLSYLRNAGISDLSGWNFQRSTEPVPVNMPKVCIRCTGTPEAFPCSMPKNAAFEIILLSSLDADEDADGNASEDNDRYVTEAEHAAAEEAVTLGMRSIDAVKTHLNAGATGGTFTLTFAGGATGSIAWNASAATVQTAVRLVTGMGAATVSGNNGGPWTIDRVTVGDYAQPTGTATSLTPSGSGVAIALSRAGTDVLSPKWTVALRPVQSFYCYDVNEETTEGMIEGRRFLSRLTFTATCEAQDG